MSDCEGHGDVYCSDCGATLGKAEHERDTMLQLVIAAAGVKRFGSHQFLTAVVRAYDALPVRVRERGDGLAMEQFGETNLEGDDAGPIAEGLELVTVAPGVQTLRDIDHRCAFCGCPESKHQRVSQECPLPYGGFAPRACCWLHRRFSRRRCIESVEKCGFKGCAACGVPACADCGGEP